MAKHRGVPIRMSQELLEAIDGVVPEGGSRSETIRELIRSGLERGDSAGPAPPAAVALAMVAVAEGRVLGELLSRHAQGPARRCVHAGTLRRSVPEYVTPAVLELATQGLLDAGLIAAVERVNERSHPVDKEAALCGAWLFKLGTKR